MKLTRNQIEEIRDETLDAPRFYGRKRLAKKYNVSESTIKDVVNYKSYK
jgi:Mor family transcriptional regulator